ncbi:MAG: synthase delta chain [Thermoleophilia bacterium]|nr:synthase delta chain [Thermoleophilia bacterium]
MSAPARIYAGALLEAAGADAARVADELDAVAALATDSPTEWNALIAPGIVAATRKAAIDKLLADAHALTRNVLKVLVDNGRLEETAELAREFRSLVRDRESKLDVHVTSAIELSDELRAKLEKRLSDNTGKQVTLHASVDPEIIGGLVVQHGDTLVDTSLRGRLDSLKLALSRPAPRTAPSTDQ